MALLRAAVRAATVTPACLATAVGQVVGAGLRLEDLATKTSVLWQFCYVMITAAWAGPSKFWPRNITRSLDPLMNALDMERGPAMVARVHMSPASHLADADHAVVATIPKLGS